MPAQDPLSAFIGDTPAAERVRSLARRAATVAAPVLIEGETGTGKSLLARLVHESSARARASFVAVNCAGVPDSLFESEMFGHAEGAFTGAQRARPGLFQLADGGTLFLDEVGELPLSQQPKLLLALEDGEVRRVGGRRPDRVQVRVLAASSRSLPDAAARGEFRTDLLFRIALLRIRIPPLRDRPEDIPALARRLADRVGRAHRGRPVPMEADALELIRRSPWPGNVRELQFVIEAAIILASGTRIRRCDIEAALEHSPAPPLTPRSGSEAPVPGEASGE